MLGRLRKLLRKPMPLGLSPSTGSISGHLFENARVSLARNLFWIVEIEFEPVHFGDEDWDCSLGIEWLTWPIRSWRDLDGMSLGQVQLGEILECSFYLFGQHHPATLRRLVLRETERAKFEADFSAVADVVELDGSRRLFEISGKCELKFSGIIVVPENLQPKPVTAQEAEAAISEFLIVDDLEDARSEGWRYVFEPAI